MPSATNRAENSSFTVKFEVSWYKAWGSGQDLVLFAARFKIFKISLVSFEILDTIDRTYLGIEYSYRPVIKSV